MALTKCFECGRDVSTLAASCPNCGAPVQLGDGRGPTSESRPTTPPPRSLAALSDKALKDLSYAKRNINVVTALLIFSTAFLVLAMLFPRGAARVLGLENLSKDEGLVAWAILAAVTLFYVAAIVGIILRTRWGRLLAFACCAIALLNIPVGTIIGALGLIYFAKGGALFGPERITSDQLKVELASRKAK